MIIMKQFFPLLFYRQILSLIDLEKPLFTIYCLVQLEIRMKNVYEKNTQRKWICQDVHGVIRYILLHIFDYLGISRPFFDSFIVFFFSFFRGKDKYNNLRLILHDFRERLYPVEFLLTVPNRTAILSISKKCIRNLFCPVFTFFIIIFHYSSDEEI